LYEDYKLSLGKDWFEIVRVDCGIASILLFRIDIPLSSKSVQFGAKMTRTESTTFSFDIEGNQRSCGYFQVVNIHKF